MSEQLSDYARRANVLLRDYGYRFCGHILTSRAIPGWTSEQVIGRFDSHLAAVEHLIPRVAEDEFTNRAIAL